MEAERDSTLLGYIATWHCLALYASVRAIYIVLYWLLLTSLTKWMSTMRDIWKRPHPPPKNKYVFFWNAQTKSTCNSTIKTVFIIQNGTEFQIDCKVRQLEWSIRQVLKYKSFACIKVTVCPHNAMSEKYQSTWQIYGCAKWFHCWKLIWKLSSQRMNSVVTANEMMVFQKICCYTHAHTYTHGQTYICVRNDMARWLQFLTNDSRGNRFWICLHGAFCFTSCQPNHFHFLLDAWSSSVWLSSFRASIEFV